MEENWHSIFSLFTRDIFFFVVILDGQDTALSGALRSHRPQRRRFIPTLIGRVVEVLLVRRRGILFGEIFLVIWSRHVPQPETFRGGLIKAPCPCDLPVERIYI